MQTFEQVTAEVYRTILCFWIVFVAFTIKVNLSDNTVPGKWRFYKLETTATDVLLLDVGKPNNT